MGVPENIDALLVKYDISQARLAKIAGVSRSAVVAWRKGSVPKMPAINRICEALDVTIDDILSDEHGLAAKEHGRDVSEPFDMEGYRNSYTTLETLGKVHAGEFDEEVVEHKTIPVPAQVLENHPEAKAVTVNGNCMNRVLPNGCAVVYDPDLAPHNGSIVIVETEEYDAILRRWFLHNKTLVLAADSYEDYEDIVIRNTERPIRVIGVVVWYQSDGELD